MKKGKQKKQEAPHTAEAMKAGKKAIIKALASGMGPGEAAENVGIGRSTAYEWKREDADFSAHWDNAVQTSFDKVESVLYKLAISGDRQACMDILKHRRGDVYNNNAGDKPPTQQLNYFLNVPMEERIKRLERLGLPVPVIEPDYQIIDAGEDANRS
jgi:hypothetical protein